MSDSSDESDYCLKDNDPRLTSPGGYHCQFVESPKELQFECAICLFIVKKPYLVSCCGHRFCAECIKRVKKKGKACPRCDKSFTIFPDKLLQKTLKRKLVFCSHMNRGCQWTGELSKLDSHLMECEYVPLICPNGCGHNSLFRLSLQHHVHKDCPLTLLRCSVCNERILRKDMATHKKMFAEEHIAALETQVKVVKEEAFLMEENVKKETTKLIKLLTPSESLQTLMRRIKPRKICIHNLPCHASEGMIRSFCGQYGRIKESSHYPSLSVAVVEFESTDSVKKLLKSHGELSEGHIETSIWGEVLNIFPLCK